MTLKRCSRCGKDKPLDEFYLNRAAKDGRTRLCKPCSVIDVMERRAALPLEERRRRQRQRQRPKCKWLRAGDPIPTTEPARYEEKKGYVVLTWKVGPNEYVRTHEHRLIAGFPDAHVHHKNHDKADNVRDNLEPLSASDHARLHAAQRLDRAEAARLYRLGHSTPEIARRFSVHYSNVIRGLRAEGIILRSRGADGAGEVF